LRSCVKFSDDDRSGQSIFSRPKPIDLNSARRADIDLSDEEDGDDGRRLVGDSVLFDLEQGGEVERFSDNPGGRAVEGIDDREAADAWAS
jgi:hypothetical protein